MTTRGGIRLSIMMFLEYAIWGAWAPILYMHLVGLPDFKVGYFDATTKASLVFMTMAISSMVAPLAGQIADRYFSTQNFLAFSHLVGGVLIFWIAYLDTFLGIFLVMLLHTLLYAPTVALTNSITLHHLPAKDFGRIRLWGTIGWIVISWVFMVWLGGADGLIEIINPAWKESLVDWRQSLPDEYKPQVGHCLMVAGGISVLLAVFCLVLPRTPPSRKAENPFAFLGAVKLMKDPSFAVLIVIAFLVSTELQFYYVLTQGFFNQSGGPFKEAQVAEALEKTYANAEKGVRHQAAANLVGKGDAKENGGNGDNMLSREELAKLKDLKNTDAPAVLAHYDGLLEQKGGLALSEAWVGPVLTFGQIAEIFVLLAVPYSLKRFGFRYTIAFGILAWSIRYFIFSLGEPRALVIASQTLHGFGFGFFFVGCFLYGDAIATPDIRASVQGFIIFVTYGLGMVVSSLIAGPVATYFEGNWHYVFLVPASITAVCTLAFILGVREPPQPEAANTGGPT